MGGSSVGWLVTGAATEVVTMSEDHEDLKRAVATVSQIDFERGGEMLLEIA